MDTERPKGRRFTDVYREKGDRTPDGDKLRRRVAHKLDASIVEWELISTLRAETGYAISSSPTAGFWIKFIEGLSLDEFLDFLTSVAQAFARNNMARPAYEWIRFCQRALDEENSTFDMDDLGGVHFRVDHAFQSNKRAAIEALNGADKVAARQAFEEAHTAISAISGDTLTAVRRAFDAVENIFKIRFGTSRLGATEVKSKLRGIGDREGARSGNAARRFNDAFAEWVNACHLYRHAPGEDDPTPPPRWLALALVDSSATYIRYLASNSII